MDSISHKYSKTLAQHSKVKNLISDKKLFKLNFCSLRIVMVPHIRYPVPILYKTDYPFKNYVQVLVKLLSPRFHIKLRGA